MTTELAKSEGFSADEVDLIKRTICKGSTDDELRLFIGQCRRTGLDPFARQIHAIKRWNADDRREVMQVQVGIDGFRLIAERTERYDGQDGPYWCGADGGWKDAWLSPKPPAAARVVVHKQGCKIPFVGVAHWAEYAQTKKDGSLTRMWARMPALMLAKCAEALALRKAFPQELSGLYTPEEMAQAHQPEHADANTEPAVHAAAPTPPELPAANHAPEPPRPADRAKIAAAALAAVRATSSLGDLQTYCKCPPLPRGFMAVKDEHSAALVCAIQERKLAFLQEEIDELCRELGYDVVKLAMLGQSVGIADIDAMDATAAAKLVEALRKDAANNEVPV